MFSRLFTISPKNIYRRPRPRLVLSVSRAVRIELFTARVLYRVSYRVLYRVLDRHRK